MNGMKKFLDDTLIPLHHTIRFGPYPSVDEKSVAAHSFDVAILSYFFAIQVDSADPRLALEKAILHDLEESETGDIPRFVKHDNLDLKKELEQVEEETVAERLDGVVDGHEDELWEVWKNSKDDTLEGQIVKAADILSAIMDFYTEERLGNQLMYEHADIEDGIRDAVEICHGIDPAYELLIALTDGMNHDVQIPIDSIPEDMRDTNDQKQWRMEE